ncbi:glycosyltransferase family 2 protein [Marinibacterium profundimaris]|uniref:Glycosyl transferase family 2 n=1 Tax=Marinibacterium profundimaris TaxID=1679460 RepID=A0A225NE96_9RHOB|nr:glycosyltransferase family 2 protein [Marinibacterium profundimaris]OWU70549.1 hypothetical protein ATO3_20005 [Marinibacterium profundimaris]
MYYGSFEDFLNKPDRWAVGPLAMIFVEDEVEIDTTLRHHRDCGFRTIVAFMPDDYPSAPDLVEQIHRVRLDTVRRDVVPDTVNRMIAAAPGLWMYYCYNAEYLYYPFSETRSVGEMLSFHTEERRDAMLTYVVDLYADDLKAHPSAVSLDRAHLDRTGYYALARLDPDSGFALERQLDFFGGLRWRFEEHVPRTSRRIDRVGLFRSKPGLSLRGDHTFDDEEYNTYACPWHHNLTAAICSFRTAKALKRNPGSTFDITTFHWHNSVPFNWQSRQLLDLGLMEPGQWF